MAPFFISAFRFGYGAVCDGAICLGSSCLDGMRIEGSVMTSLAELRQIEEQRLLSERQSRIAEEEARVMAKAAAEQAIRDAEAKRIADERAAALAIEEARVTAEREARMRVEAAEAAERARHQAALDEQRLAQEMEIARELARRTKPKWMLAVTVGAVLAASGLTWFAIDRMRAADDAARIAKEAHDRTMESKAAMLAMQDQVRDLDAQTEAMAKDLAEAAKTLATTEDAIAVAAARKRMKELEDRQREIDKKKAAIKAKIEHDIRVGPVKIKQECLDGVIGKKGC